VFQSMQTRPRGAVVILRPVTAADIPTLAGIRDARGVPTVARRRGTGVGGGRQSQRPTRR
jgi:hypothetical protein